MTSGDEKLNKVIYSHWSNWTIIPLTNIQCSVKQIKRCRSKCQISWQIQSRIQQSLRMQI